MTAGYLNFEPKDFHAHSAVAHAKAAAGHAQSAMEGNAQAYLRHLDAAKAHDAAALAHKTTSKHLPLPENASPPDEGTPVSTTHRKIATPVKDQARVDVPKHGRT